MSRLVFMGRQLHEMTPLELTDVMQQVITARQHIIAGYDADLTELQQELRKRLEAQ